MFVIKRKHVLIFFVISLLITLTSCQFKDPSKTHGINALKNKEKILIINKSNKNDEKLIKTYFTGLYWLL